MYWVVNWPPASPTCSMILEQSDLSPGWMLVLWEWMSDGGLCKFPAQLLISQQWSYLFGYANMLLLYLEQRAKALCGKWETVFFPGILQSPAPSLNKLITFLDFLLLLSISPSNILPQQKQKKKKKYQIGKQRLYGSCGQNVTISHIFWTVFQRNAVMSSFKERLWPKIKL